MKTALRALALAGVVGFAVLAGDVSTAKAGPYWGRPGYRHYYPGYRAYAYPYAYWGGYYPGYYSAYYPGYYAYGSPGISVGIGGGYWGGGGRYWGGHGYWGHGYRGGHWRR
ncbi:MAG TPA: hypothetical protein VEI07_22310 [Planctomycetaceae bacterium]|nr:hypothetical protein [Planctomycetaceae bacterium]